MVEVESSVLNPQEQPRYAWSLDSIDTKMQVVCWGEGRGSLMTMVTKLPEPRDSMSIAFRVVVETSRILQAMHICTYIVG